MQKKLSTILFIVIFVSLTLFISRDIDIDNIDINSADLKYFKPIILLKGKDMVSNYYYEGKYDSAIKILKKLLVIDPDDFELYYNLGNTYLKTDEPDKAIEAYKKALE